MTTLYILVAFPTVLALIAAFVSVKIASRKHAATAKALADMKDRQETLMRLREILVCNTAMINDPTGPTGTRLYAPPSSDYRRPN